MPGSASASEGVPLPGSAELSVAALGLVTGRTAAYGGGSFVTASVVEVDVPAALLPRAQDAGRGRLGERERALASAMIRRSGNDATTELWGAVGREDGLDAAHARLGLTGTRAGGDGLWGLTETTAADRITSLRQVFAPDVAGPAPTAAVTRPAPGPASRACVRTPMERIVEGQRWGVPAAARGAAEGSRWRSRTGGCRGRPPACGW